MRNCRFIKQLGGKREPVLANYIYVLDRPSACMIEVEKIYNTFICCQLSCYLQLCLLDTQYTPQFLLYQIQNTIQYCLSLVIATT